jgi:hypothetical protein
MILSVQFLKHVRMDVLLIYAALQLKHRVFLLPLTTGTHMETCLQVHDPQHLWYVICDTTYDDDDDRLCIDMCKTSVYCSIVNSQFYFTIWSSMLAIMCWNWIPCD